jgi:phosphatidylserine/phosphatidylglycerophosphate/cardiolipin synthase-like enzyme
MLSVFAGSALAGELQSCFTPGEDCAGEIVAALAAARHEVRVQAYGFTAPAIVAALMEARRRGVDVEVILDRGALAQRREEDAAQSLTRSGIPVLVDGAHAIAHNKVMVIDRTTVVTGSYNFTASAQSRNAENLLIIRDSTLAGQYAANWSHHATHSLPLGPTRTAAVRDDDQ